MAAQDLGDRFQIQLRQDPPVGLCGELRISRLGLRRDHLLEFGRIEGEIARFAQVQRHRHRAVSEDLRLVDRKAGIRIDHLVADAVIGGAKNRVGDEGLGARADDHILRIDSEAAQPPHVARRSDAQFRDPGRRRVAMPALADRLHRGVLDVHRRMEIGLPDAEGNDVLSLAHQLVHLGEHDEGVLGAELGGTAAGPGHALRHKEGKPYFSLCSQHRAALICFITCSF